MTLCSETRLRQKEANLTSLLLNAERDRSAFFFCVSPRLPSSSAHASGVVVETTLAVLFFDISSRSGRHSVTELTIAAGPMPMKLDTMAQCEGKGTAFGAVPPRRRQCRIRGRLVGWGCPSIGSIRLALLLKFGWHC